MKLNKKTIGIIAVVLVFVVAAYFISYEGSKNEKENDPFELTKRMTNLEMENEELRQEIDSLEHSFFKLEKLIIDTDLADDYIGFPDSEILYKDVDEEKYVVLLKEQQESFLMIASDSYTALLTIRSLEPEEGMSANFNGDGQYNYLGGVITDKEIEEVQVLQNSETQETELFKAEDGLYGWYSIFEYDEDNNNIKVEGLDGSANVLWEESFGDS